MPALVAGIHVEVSRDPPAWMAGTGPGHDDEGRVEPVRAAAQ